MSYRRHSVLTLLLIAAVSSTSLHCKKSSHMAEEKVAAPEYMEGAGRVAMKKKDETDKDGKDQAGETWKRSRIVPNTSKLKIGDEETLEIRGMETRVRVDGFRARVLIDYYFYNPSDRQYEGTFKVRLPNGASPYFLAFGQSKVELKPDRPVQLTNTRFDADEEKLAPETIMAARQASWIEPKRARIVPREKAAHAYGETVRRQVDPALMEWAGPGMFSARIFPIAPKKVHRVVVGYDANLTPIGDDYEFRVPVPEDIPNSRIHLAVSKMEGVEAAVEPKGETDQTPTMAHHSFENPKDRLIRIRLKGADAVALQGSDDIGDYFAAQFQPELPKEAKTKETSNAVFLVDVSLTSNPDRFNIWRKLMKAILENNRGRLDRFTVLFFNVESFWWKKKLVKNDAKNVGALLDYTNRLALEGATDVGQAFDRLAAPPDGMSLDGADVFLLSDGAVTWGEGDAFALSHRLSKSGASLFAYRTGMTGDDTAMLQHLARESGGALFSVVGESEIAAASTAHMARPWTIRGVEIDGADDVLLAGRPTTVFPGQRLTVVGRGGLPAEKAKVRLELSRQGGKTNVVTTIDNVLESPLASRTYGQIAVGQLEEFLGSTRSFAEAYARHFRVPGKSSSLLMLESEADYKQHNIVPKKDAAKVEKNKTRILVLNALDELVKKLGDPKAAFLDWAERASEMPGVKLQFDPSFHDALRTLPSEAFAVKNRPLVARKHTWEPISDDLREELAAQKPAYDTVVADAKRRLKQYGAVDALKALSSLVEVNPSDGTLARDVGYSAFRWGMHGQAFHLFRRVAESRPWEPQTYHAMAQALADAGKPNLAMAYFEIALSGEWHQRFGSFDQIVALDYLRFLRRTTLKGLHENVREFASARRSGLADKVGIEDADLVIVMTWNTDNTDIDLHVTEPSGEECYYQHRETESGGRMTRDVTQGYGPEMYVLEDAPKGRYRIRAKYYSTNRNRAGTRTKVHATIYRNWGEPTEEVTQRIVALEDGKEMQHIDWVEVQ